MHLRLSFFLYMPGTCALFPLVAVGQEFAFPIDYSTRKHWELTSSPSTVITYSNEFAICLTACCTIAELLVKEQRLYHREFITPPNQTQGLTELAIFFFAQCAVRSVLRQEQVDKLQYTFMGPWTVTAVLSGASYSLSTVSTKAAPIINKPQICCLTHLN